MKPDDYIVGRHLGPFSTLREAEDFIIANFDHGVICPVCDQRVKKYKRPLYAGMARVLIKLYHLHEDQPRTEWFLVARELIKGAVSLPNFALMRFWNLIERQEDARRDDGGRAGFYRITDLGRAFVRGRVAVPQRILHLSLIHI